MKNNADSHATSDISRCHIINLSHIGHPYGTLTVAQNSGELPFAIRRVFYIYDIPTDSLRGGHSHHKEQQLIIAAAGCFDVTVDDGTSKQTYTLRRPYEALYVPAGIWRSMHGFSAGSVCLTLSSTDYDETDYVRRYDKFLELKSIKRQ